MPRVTYSSRTADLRLLSRKREQSRCAMLFGFSWNPGILNLLTQNDLFRNIDSNGVICAPLGKGHQRPRCLIHILMSYRRVAHRIAAQKMTVSSETMHARQKRLPKCCCTDIVAEVIILLWSVRPIIQGRKRIASLCLYLR